MRLIDADALREQLVWCKEQAGRFDTFWDDVIERLDSLPTADAVAVVRCKDCKHATMTADGNMVKYCDLYKDDDGFPIELYLEADWFCAGAERKEKENA